MFRGRPIVALGGGGHFRAVQSVLDSTGWAVSHIVDPKALLIGESKRSGQTLLCDEEGLTEVRKKVGFGLVTVGQIKTAELRVSLWNLLKHLGFICPSVVAPSAIQQAGSLLGFGSVMMHQSIIGPHAIIGQNCILNTRATVEHDCQIGDHVHIATGAIVNGGCRVGDGSFIGSGAVLRENVSIGKNCVVSAGIFVKKDLSDNQVV